MGENGDMASHYEAIGNQEAADAVRELQKANLRLAKAHDRIEALEGMLADAHAELASSAVALAKAKGETG